MAYFALLISILMVAGCGSFRTGDEKLEDKLPTGQIHHYTDGSHPIRYLRAGNPKGPLLFMIHGAPGSLDVYEDYLQHKKLTDRFDIVAMDRPGYGYSRYGEAEPGISEQALILMELLNDLNKDEVFLTGHSYGASIAAAMAGMQGHKIKGLILMASTMSPPDEVVFWFNYLAQFPPVKWFLSGALGVANKEKMVHARELQKNLSLFNRYHGRVLVLHAKKDFLAPFEGNIAIMEELYGSQMTYVLFDKGNHMFIWNQSEKVVQAILDFASQKKMAAQETAK